MVKRGWAEAVQRGCRGGAEGERWNAGRREAEGGTGGGKGEGIFIKDKG